MKVYTLTAEPYHDNSSVVGVFLDEPTAIEVWKASPNPDDINCDDYQLAEWDTDTNEQERVWYAQGKQVNDPTRKGWNPIRKDFEFKGPE